MANRWTDEQLEAINTEGSNVIVSAGAGSGKTAVLTERVLRKVKDGISVNRLLILTFTKAASEEMRTRIRKTLKKEGFLDQVNLIDSSYITTFDSYSLAIVKKYHTYLNISGNIKITDQTIIDIKKKEILEKIMDEKYKENSSRFEELVAHFALKNDTDLKSMILSINNKLDLRYDKKEYLENYEENYYSNEKIDEIINEYLLLIKNKRKIIKNLLDDIRGELEGETLEKFEYEINKIVNKDNYDELKVALDTFKMPRKNKEYTDKAVVLKDYIKSVINDLKDLCIYESVDSIKNSLLNSKDDTLEIIDIILRLDEKYNKIKYKEEMFDFNDISHLAIKLVKENEEVRNEIRDSFGEILIDEYQDTSDTQEMFINEIANNNVYMVGDIKQSIYRFRNANPYIFKDKYDTYSKDNKKGKKIDLIKNFRSREEVLNNINLIFSKIMDDEIGGANYIKEHQMVFGNKTYIEEGKTNQNYNMTLLNYEVDERYKKDVQEAFIIGYDIKNKIENKVQIFDKDEKVLRDIEYKDCAILLDVKKNFNLYKQIFEYLNIPLLLYSDTNLTLSDDLYVLKNLVKLIILVKENNYNAEFKYVFISVARSFLFNYMDDYIYDVFENNSFKGDEIVKKALKLKDKIDYLPLEELFNEILEEYNYEDKILNTKDIIDKEKRLEYIINLLSDLSQMGYTLYDLSYYLEEVTENNYSIKYKPYQDSTNSVKIMSIHASKGLEFPICYFSGFENRFNQLDLKQKIAYDNNYGIMLPEIDEESIPTIRMKLYKIKSRREDISERIRLFYVALTRAKEKMIMVLPKKEDESIESKIVSNIVRDKYISFDSIMESIRFELEPYIKDIKDVKYTNEYLYKQELEEIKIDNNGKFIVNNLLFTEEAKEESHFSKTKITLIDKETKENMEIGTKVHQILEEIDFKNPDIDDLDLDNFLKRKIEKFINSKLIKENLNSKIFKEYEFIDDSDNEVKRGIIDLLIENEKEIIIVDYKLNNVLDEAYKKQLNGYKDEISKISNKPIKLYLYSIIEEKLEKVENL